MTIVDLKSFDKIYPIFVQKYETYIPSEEVSGTVEKINSIITYLNQIGRLSNDVVSNWNKVMIWVMGEGLTETVEGKIDTMLLDGIFATLLDGIVNEKFVVLDAKYESLDALVDAKIVELEIMVGEKITELETILVDLRDNGTGIDAQARADIVTTNQQLAETVEEIDYLSVEKVYARRSNQVEPMVSFYLDDGYTKDYTIVLPYASARNIPVTTAIMATSQLTTAQLLELQNVYGWEIQSHTYSHEHLTTLSDEYLDFQLKEGRDYIRSLGLHCESVCYPYGEANKNVIDVVKKYYRAGFGSEQGIARPPIDTFSIKRVSLDNNTVAQCKQYVDDIGSNGWIIFYTHTGTMIEGQQYNFMDIMDYVQVKNIKTVTCKEALDTFENRLDIGDRAYGGVYAKIGADGTHDFSSMPIIYKGREDNINAKSITSFALDKITIHSFKLGVASDIPFDVGVGTLVTNRMSTVTNQDYSAFQIWYGYMGTVRFRRWDATSWYPWQSIGDINVEKLKAYTNDSPLTDFPAKKITTVSVGSTDGFPSLSGTLYVSRVSNSANQNFQLFYPYDDPAVFYRRTWGIAWSAWSKFSAPIKHATTYDFGSLTAGEIKKVNLTVTGARTGQGVTVSFVNGLADAVISMASVLSNDTVEVKLTSVSQSQATVGNKPIVITLI